MLLTGFEPFGGEDFNPSAEVVRAFQGRPHLTTAILPVTFRGARQAMAQLLKLYQPGIVFMLGLARSRSVVSLERVALNWVDAEIPDNEGEQPLEQPLVAGSPAALFGKLPFKLLRQALQNAGIPAEVSHSAGTYVCNAVYYDVLHTCSVPAGFVHVPPIDKLPLAEQVRAVEVLLEWAESLQTAT